MTKGDSFVSVIVPLALILLAFFFMEQYDRRAKNLTQAKETLIQTEESIRKSISLPTHSPSTVKPEQEAHIHSSMAETPPILHPSNRNIGHFEIAEHPTGNNERRPHPQQEESMRPSAKPVSADYLDLGHFSKFISSDIRSENIRNRGYQHAVISPNADVASITSESTEQQSINIPQEMS